MKIYSKFYLMALVMILAITPAGYTQNTENCTVTINGQRVLSGPIGSRFTVRNIPADGSLVRACVICTDSEGETLYAISRFFEIVDTETFIILDDMEFSTTPPVIVRTLRGTADIPTLTEIGQTTPLQITATLSDGSMEDVTSRINGTTYQASNPEIATVDRHGLVSAMGTGMAFITALNSGVSTVVQVDISLGDPLTKVSGFVLRPDGTPIAGVTVSLIGLSGSATTNLDGSYTINGVATVFDIEGLIVEDFEAEKIFGITSNSMLTPMPGAVTDAGIITAQSLCDAFQGDCTDNDDDGIPDSLEPNLSLDPGDPDSNDDGTIDGREDTDNDGLLNFWEIVLTSDPNNPDSDGDGLADGDEIFVYNTELLDTDSDDDGWSDGIEITDQSDPLDPASQPQQITVARPPLHVVLPTSGSGANITLARPPLQVVLPKLGSGADITLARPPLQVVLPELGLGADITLARPPMQILLPASGSGADVTLARPPLQVVLPELGSGADVTLARPPIQIIIPTEVGGAAVTVAAPPAEIIIAE